MEVYENGVQKCPILSLYSGVLVWTIGENNSKSMCFHMENALMIVDC